MVINSQTLDDAIASTSSSSNNLNPLIESCLKYIPIKTSQNTFSSCMHDQMLESNRDDIKLEAMRCVTVMTAKGKLTVPRTLFPHIVKNVSSKNPELKKLIYLYLTSFADQEPDLALLPVATLQKSLKSPNPLVRSSALKILTSMRLNILSAILMATLRNSVNDLSPYVRKTVAHSIIKIYRLDPELKDDLIEYVDRLFNDKNSMVLSSAVAAFEIVCPDKLELVHKQYRRFCFILADCNEWGQTLLLKLLMRYTLDSLKNMRKGNTKDYSPSEHDPKILLRSAKPLVHSHNSAVVVAVVRLFIAIANHNEVRSTITRPLIRLLNGHREVQLTVLDMIEQLTSLETPMFEEESKSGTDGIAEKSLDLKTKENKDELNIEEDRAEKVTVEGEEENPKVEEDEAQTEREKLTVNMGKTELDEEKGSVGHAQEEEIEDEEEEDEEEDEEDEDEEDEDEDEEDESDSEEDITASADSESEKEGINIKDFNSILNEFEANKDPSLYREIFRPYLKSFFVRHNDTTQIRLAKLKILTNLSSPVNVSQILKELQAYVAIYVDDREFVSAAIHTIGRCAILVKEVAHTCLNGLTGLLSNNNEHIVSEAIVVLRSQIMDKKTDNSSLKGVVHNQTDNHGSIDGQIKSDGLKSEDESQDDNQSEKSTDGDDKIVSTVIKQVTKLMPTVTAPSARATILWILAAFCDKNLTAAKCAPNVLRLMAKSFCQEESFVKLQCLTLISKFLLSLDKEKKAELHHKIQLLSGYLFSLAKYDMNHDVRDRGRFLKKLLEDEDLCSKVLGSSLNKVC